MLPTITPDKIDLPPGTMLHFPGTLADYEQILVQLGDRACGFTHKLKFSERKKVITVHTIYA